MKRSTKKDKGPRPAVDLIEELAGLSLVLSVDDTETLTQISDLLGQLEEDARTREVVSEARQCLSIIGARAEGADLSLERLCLLIEDLQTLVTSTGVQGYPEVSPGTLALPAWVDEGVFREFIGNLPFTMEDIEAAILQLESGEPDARALLRRKIHTLKGEAGVLGLVDLEQVCHKAEDLLDGSARDVVLADSLLVVKDWIGIAGVAYAELRIPEGAGAVMESLGRALEGAQRAEQGGASAVPSKSEEEPVRVSKTEELGQPTTRDEETVALIGEFLEESEDGLSRVDEVLLSIEQSGGSGESVNQLFRVFHTIKGVAGFLAFDDIQRLAHTTETLLNQVRQGERELCGAALDLVFDSTAMMRSMTGSVRVAVEKSREIPAVKGLEELVSRLETVIEGRTISEPELPRALPGDKLGEILTRVPVSLSPAAIVQALETQKESGRKLGEELVAEGLAQPKQVAHALRAQAQAEDAGGKGASKIKETVKVDLERVDSLVEMIGELVIVQSMVVHAKEIAAIASPKVRTYLGQLEKITRDLQDTGMAMRMVPVRGVFQKMSRMVRDLSHKSGKRVRIEVSGEATEMDRSMVEQIADPLVHMIRNAVDHGIEAAVEDRIAAGKDPLGLVTLSAYHEGGSIVVEIADDGRGLDKEAILLKARRQGLIDANISLSDNDIYALIFQPGFSTAQQVTEISGRGVGMDVVKRNIDAMRGRVAISTQKGKGTKFKIILPLTLAIIDGMQVACGAERYIVPTLSIVESLQVTSSMIVTFSDRGELINVRGDIIPLIRLDRLFFIKGAKQDPSQGLVVVVEGVGHKVGLFVDDVVTQQQVVIKSLGAGVGKTEFVSGAAIMSDGKVGLILNVEEIAALVEEQAKRAWRRGTVQYKERA
jgi:two-component system chemotaxis sensor kinase CheA